MGWTFMFQTWIQIFHHTCWINAVCAVQCYHPIIMRSNAAKYKCPETLNTICSAIDVQSIIIPKNMRKSLDNHPLDYLDSVLPIYVYTIILVTIYLTLRRAIYRKILISHNHSIQLLILINFSMQRATNQTTNKCIN